MGGSCGGGSECVRLSSLAGHLSSDSLRGDCLMRNVRERENVH